MQAGEIWHGKTSPIVHDEKGIFSGIKQCVQATRYHSLVGSDVSLPADLEVTARVSSLREGKGLIMGVRHRTLAVEGVQFHPESIVTEEGKKMLQNFLKMKMGTWNE